MLLLAFTFTFRVYFALYAGVARLGSNPQAIVDGLTATARFLGL